MKRLVINRANWGRGQYRAHGLPSCALGRCEDAFGHMSMIDESLQHDIVTANDHLPNGPEREQRIAELFAQAGVEVVYEGEYV